MSWLARALRKGQPLALRRISLPKRTLFAIPVKHRGRPRLFLVRFLFLLLLSILKKTKQVSISFMIVKTLRVESNEIKYTKLQKALFQRKGLIVLAFVASNDDCDMHKGPVIIYRQGACTFSPTTFLEI